MVITKENIIKALKELGLKENDNVIVHTSLKSIGYISGGAITMVSALLDTVGKDGTIMMPTQSQKNLDPNDGVHWEIDEKEYQIIRDTWPAYDKDLTPTNTMGQTAETLRQWKGSFRSDHPARSFAAVGKYAKYLTQDHDLSNIFGIGSPLDKLYKLNGKILLIGVSYDKNTSIHLADAIANYPSKHNVTEYSAIIENGKRVWKAYDTLYVDGEDFLEIGEDFEKENKVSTIKLGNATLKLIDMKSLVDFSIKWIEKNRK